MNRRHLLILLTAPGWSPSLAQATSPLPRLAVLEAEMADDHDNPATRAAQHQRLTELAAHVRQELAAQGLYRVVDLAPAAALIERLTGQRAALRDCDPCADDIGRALGVDLVMTPWVLKTSELILTLSLQIYSVRAGRLVHMKSVQMRGNRDDSWQRAASYLVRDMAERRARRADYGQ
ncbi:MAG: DUF3280 domain-containing protein [Proteobacteria bacterium]|nr:DUF3280 domain-containing protein [Pseudomonadota bacterium]